MDKDALDQINDVVRKALPAHLSEELRKALDDGAKAKQQVHDMTIAMKLGTAELEKAQAQLRTHEALNERHARLMTAEAQVKIREHKMELNEYMVKAAMERVAEMKEIVSLVFKNNSYKYTRSSTTNTPLGNGMTAFGSANESIDTEGSKG